MKINIFILAILIVRISPATSQTTLEVKNSLDSTVIETFLCIDLHNEGSIYQGHQGKTIVPVGIPIQILHPNYQLISINKIYKDTLIYLDPLESEIDEVIIRPMNLELIYSNVISNYQKKLIASKFSKQLSYNNTNYFHYLDSENTLLDSAYCITKSFITLDYTPKKKRPFLL